MLHVSIPLTPSFLSVSLAALEAPRYRRSLTNQTVNVTGSLRMECDAEGRPLPRLSWFKDNQPLHQMSGARERPRRRSRLSACPRSRRLSQASFGLNVAILLGAIWRQLQLCLMASEGELEAQAPAILRHMYK